MKKGLRQLIPTEAQEQAALIEWAAVTNIPDTFEKIGKYIFAIANGGSRHKLEAKNLKKQGVRAGVPDLFLAYPSRGYAGMFIEMKRKETGRLSKEQREWITRLRHAGFYAVIADRGWDEVIKVIMNYLGASFEKVTKLEFEDGKSEYLTVPRRPFTAMGRMV